MTPQQAAARWQKRQEQLIRDAYQQGWQTGSRNYARQHPASHPTTTARPATTTPAAPNTATMTRVLSPALSSVQRIATQIAVLAPTAAQIAATATLAAAIALAVREFLLKNAFLLALAVYVLWAAEQAGYAEAAARDGQLLEWQLDARADHCDDCPALAALPPMRLDQWPTLPGEGATDCRQGCKCSLHSVPGARPRALTVEEQDLLARIANRQPVLVAA